MLQNWLPGISLISISCGTEEKEISSPQMEDGLLSYWTSPDQLREFISSSSWRKSDLIKSFPFSMRVLPNTNSVSQPTTSSILKWCFGVWSSTQSRNSSSLFCISERILCGIQITNYLRVQESWESFWLSWMKSHHHCSPHLAWIWLDAAPVRVGDCVGGWLAGVKCRYFLLLQTLCHWKYFD